MITIHSIIVCFIVMIVLLIALPYDSLIAGNIANKMLQKKFNQFLHDVLQELIRRNHSELNKFLDNHPLTTIELCTIIRPYINELSVLDLNELSKNHIFKQSWLLAWYQIYANKMDPNHDIIPKELLEGDYVAYLFRLLRESDNCINV